MVLGGSQGLDDLSPVRYRFVGWAGGKQKMEAFFAQGESDTFILSTADDFDRIHWLFLWGLSHSFRGADKEKGKNAHASVNVTSFWRDSAKAWPLPREMLSKAVAGMERSTSDPKSFALASN